MEDIESLSHHLQAPLLQALETGDFVPYGSWDVRRADVRIVATSSVDLASMGADGSLREDLYHRLSVLSITIPPLRDRREDIPLLANYYLQRLARNSDAAPPEILPEDMQRLVAHDWPGNVRELVHQIQRGMVFRDGNALGLDLPTP